MIDITRISSIFIFILLLFSCVSPGVEEIEEVQLPETDIARDSLEVVEKIQEELEPDFISELEQKMIDAGLVDIQNVDSTLLVDVKYATEDNFMKRVLYEDYHKVYLQREVAERLAKAQQALKKKDSNLSLLVFDGTRPRSVQQEMWDALDTLAFSERTKFVSNPANGSLHNLGCAVDLTILNLKTGEALDMGAGYDDLRKIAYPRHEERFLASGELTPKQVENRKLLREVMNVGGFWVIQTEWWHFNAYSRDRAKEIYSIIE